MNTQPSAIPVASSPPLATLLDQADNLPLTHVSLAHIESYFKLYLRFGLPVRIIRLDRWRRVAVFLPNAIFCRIRWQANDYGTVRWQLMVMQSGLPRDAMQRISGVKPGARLLLHTQGDHRVRTMLEHIDAIEAQGIAPATVPPVYWRTLANRLAARFAFAVARIHRRAACRLAGREGAAMTAASTAGPASRSRSRLSVRVVLIVLSVCGLAALAWASFVQPLPRLIYNPSDSVAVGWYRLDPLQHPSNSLPHRLEVGSLILTTLPPETAVLAAQRGYLPDHIPLLKRVGAVAPQHVCIAADQVRIDGVPVAALLHTDRLGRELQAWPHCRQLQPGELFLLSVTNPASFDSRYFGPVSVSAVIGVASPVWLKKRP